MTVRRIVFAMVVGIAAVGLFSCGGSASGGGGGGGGQKLTPHEQKMQAMREKMQLDSMEAAQKIQTMENENKLAMAAEKNKQVLEGVKDDGRERERLSSNIRSITKTPCYQESLAKPGFTMGFGMSSPVEDQKDARPEANRMARSDLADKFIGVIKNASDYYNKNTQVPSGKRMTQNQLEGISLAITQKILNKEWEVICAQTAEDNLGNHIAYQAVQMPRAEAKQIVASELEVLKVDVDKKLYLDGLNAELEAMSEREQAELDAARGRLQGATGQE